VGLSASLLTGTGVERCVAGQRATIKLEAKVGRCRLNL
jgi:hypothetical protein